MTFFQMQDFPSQAWSQDTKEGAEESTFKYRLQQYYSYFENVFVFRRILDKISPDRGQTCETFFQQSISSALRLMKGKIVSECAVSSSWT